MCRIVGFVDRQSNNPERDIIAMRDAMSHGGPDSSGSYLDTENGVALGHRRLSIIDLSDAGNQPMYNQNRDLVLIFNGEIYNYRELKRELEQLGTSFFSHSDTEVILRSYEQWGSECFSLFKGMFAIVIYDKKLNRIILARDHAGIKPLHYFAGKDCFYFGSEIRSFSQVNKNWEENPDWKLYFLAYGFLPQEQTTLKGVKSLPRGTYIELNTGNFQLKQCVYTEYYFSNLIKNEKEARQEIRYSLKKAVQRHLIADAPLGVFLSGGIDSSILTMLAAEMKEDLHTLSIVFEDKNYTEKIFQDLIVKKIHSIHQSSLLNKQQFMDAIPDILKAMDQPSTDGINSYFISKFAREAGLKTVLSGLGADELLGGYPSFKRIRLINSLKHIPDFVLDKARLLPNTKFHKLSFLKNKGNIGDYLFNRGYFNTREIASLLDLQEEEINKKLYCQEEVETDLKDGNLVSFLETTIYMEGQLLKDTDYMSMWHGLEVRVPFLDYDLMNTIHSISPAIKFSNQNPKQLLIDSFKDMLPLPILTRKKQGFVFPFAEWMKESLNDFMKTKKDWEMAKKFEEGKLTWSRFWAYVLMQVYGS
jgi:asparagine synthase (glutamine-hydrolysing)